MFNCSYFCIDIYTYYRIDVYISIQCKDTNNIPSYKTICHINFTKVFNIHFYFFLFDIIATWQAMKNNSSNFTFSTSNPKA